MKYFWWPNWLFELRGGKRQKRAGVLWSRCCYGAFDSVAKKSACIVSRGHAMLNRFSHCKQKEYRTLDLSFQIWTYRANSGSRVLVEFWQTNRPHITSRSVTNCRYLFIVVFGHFINLRNEILPFQSSLVNRIRSGPFYRYVRFKVC